MEKLFALFSAERNFSAFESFEADSLSNYALLRIRGGGEPTGRSEDPVFVFDKK